MSDNFKPGDVALIEAGCHANRRPAIRTGTPSNMGWAYSDLRDGKSTQNWTADTHGTVSVVRPLAVIDPEDAHDIEAICTPDLRSGIEGILRVSIDDAQWERISEKMQAALREFADPTPKVEEPLGLGAVIETNDGRRFVRVAGRDSRFPWVDAGKPADNAYNWVSHGGLDGATPLRVVNEGVAVHG